MTLEDVRGAEAGTSRPWVALETMDVDRLELPHALAFCDSTGDNLFRDGSDIELSHWYPNRTPQQFRADTSTEMVLRFVGDHRDHEFTGVGVHCDTDAALSLFSLVEPACALANAGVIAATAEAGDFGFWLDDGAAALYESVRQAWEPRSGDANRDRIHRSFESIRATLGADTARTCRTLDRQRSSDELIGDGVERRQLDEHFVAYVVGPALASEHLAAIETTPRFDQPVERVWLSHRTRNRLDAERFQLLSVPKDDGWQHTIWYPQYLPWDTSTLWRPDGLEYTGARLEWRWTDPRLDAALAVVNAVERVGRWQRAELLAPWAPQFPILASIGLGDTRPSAMPPEEIADALRGTFESVPTA